MPSTAEAAIEQLANGLSALDRYLTHSLGPSRLLNTLGWELPPGVADIGLAGIDLSGVIDKFDALAAIRVSGSDIEVAEAYVELAVAVSNLFAQLGTIATGFAATPDYLARTHIAEEFFPRLLDLVVAQTIAVLAPPAFAVGQLFGILLLEPHEADPVNFQTSHLRHVVRWDRIATLLTDPVQLFRDVYGWGTADFDADALVVNIAGLIQFVGVGTRIRSLPRQAEERLAGRPVPEADTDPTLQLFVSLVKGLGFDPLDIGVTLYGLHPSVAGGVDGGFGLSPYVQGTADLRFPLAEHVVLTIEASVDIQGGVALVLRPGRGLQVNTDFNTPPTGAAAPSANLIVALRYEADSGRRIALLTLPDTLRMEATALSAGGGMRDGASVVEAAMEGGRLVIDATGADGFLAAFFPAETVVDLALAVGYDEKRGVTFRGGAGLAFTRPLTVEFGPLRVDRLDLALAAAPSGLGVQVRLAGGVDLGPFAASVDRIGASAKLAFTAGNLGPLDLTFAFLPPTGLGLEIDAGPVSGGGFIGFDQAAGRYSGALDLQAGPVGITALGLLDTKLPGGQPGFSLLVVLQGRFPPVEVGFGIALSGIGGLLGLNRRIDVDALRQRFAAGGAGDILSPEDPIRDAPILLATLDAVFPIAPGVTVVGPTLQLSWAELVQVDLGLFLELPGPAKIVLLGSARAVIDNPAGGSPYLQLRLDILGVLDFTKRTLEFDAVLIDSQLLEVFELSGGAAFRLSWGDQPYVVLSVGGFHPSYDPAPLAFPASLTRIAMTRGQPTDVLYLRFEGYFAVTTNTLQFGAAVQVIVNAGPIRAEGFLGFDALIRFQPFFFQFSFEASLRLSFHGATLAGVRVSGVLSGPGPVTFTGELCFDILFFEICWHGTFTLGSSTPPEVHPIVSALPLLGAELRAPANLSAAAGDDPAVHLTPPHDVTLPVLQPLGQLVWTQKRAPLGLLLQRLEGAPLDQQETITASGTRVTGAARDWFAPGGFADLSDSDALNRRAFEQLQAGVQLGAAGEIPSPDAVPHTVKVDQYRIPDKPNTLDPVILPGWLHAAINRRDGVEGVAVGPPAVTVHDEQWTVWSPDGGTAVSGVSESQAHQLAKANGAVATAAGDRVPAMAF
jgi:hypothetical protein